MLDRPVLPQALEGVGRVPRGDRRIGSGEHCSDHRFDLVNAGERSSAVVRNDDFDIGAEQRIAPRSHSVRVERPVATPLTGSPS
jgi:hypothetical protein